MYLKGSLIRSLRYFFRILFIAYQRIKVIKRTLILYAVALFFFIISVTLCQFRLIFLDPKLLKIYEKNYFNISGLMYYLPGKYEVFYVSFVFMPIWTVHFLFSMNLNLFLEDKTMEQKELEELDQSENRKNTIKLDDDFNPKFSSSNFSKKEIFRKKVIIVNSWKELTFSQKSLRNVIVFIPIIVIISINLITQYSIAFFIGQKYFNLFNIAGNIFVMYILIFHFTVFMPLMLLRGKVLLEGDYLWSPSCNFIVQNSTKLDRKGLKNATDNYDEKYLTLVAHGFDPTEDKNNFDVENGKMYWKKSKLADFAKHKDQDYFSMSGEYDLDEGINPNRPLSKSKNLSPFTVKYSTFDQNNVNFPEIDQNSDLRSKKSKFTETSEWSENTKGTKGSEEVISNRQKNNPLTGNDFSEDDYDNDNFSENLSQNRSSGEFIKISEEKNEEDSIPHLDSNSDIPSLQSTNPLMDTTDLEKGDKLNNDLYDYFTDIDKKVKNDQNDLSKNNSKDISPELSDKDDDDYFNVNLSLIHI